MSRHRFHVATSFLPTVKFLGRDTKNPGHDLPHCHLCRDLKNDVATSNQLSFISATSRHRFFHVATSLCATHVVTSKVMSRPQAQPSQVVTSKPGRDQPLFPLRTPLSRPKNLGHDAKPPVAIPARSRRPFLVATSCPNKPGCDLRSMS